MRERNTRRAFLSSVGAVTLTGLAGCAATELPGVNNGPDRTLYVGAYHWGFVVLDETGTERDQITIDRGSTVKIVGFGIEAHEAVESLPSEIQEELPSHEQLESRNAERIPAPSEEYLHEALEAAEERYSGHSLSIVPAGAEQHGGGMMDGGMMGSRGLYLSQDATEPVVQTMTANQTGVFSVDCGTYCGYGHQYMDKSGVFVVQ